MSVPIGKWLDGVKFNVTCPACKKVSQITIGFLRRNRGIITPCPSCNAGIKLDAEAALMEIDNYLSDYAFHLKQHKKMPKRQFMSKIGVSLADSEGEEVDELPFDYSVYEDTLQFMVDAMNKDEFSDIAQEILKLNRISPALRGNSLPKFILLVLTGGKWDYKRPLLKRKLIGADIKGKGKFIGTPIRGDTEFLYFFDIWGNIHFGYIGKAVGFTEFELSAGSLGNDIVRGLSIPEALNDMTSVSIGFKLFDMGLNKQNLHSLIFNARMNWSENITRYKIESLSNIHLRNS